MDQTIKDKYSFVMEIKIVVINIPVFISKITIN